MSNELDKNIDAYFFTLVTSLQAAAWQQLGKIASPITGKVERNLPQAQMSIDLLNMIAEKTKGNLSPDESRLISGILYELRLNYVDESNKPAANGKTGTDNHDSERSEPQGGAESADGIEESAAS
jgi:hypothetical protein